MHQVHILDQNVENARDVVVSVDYACFVVIIDNMRINSTLRISHLVGKVSNQEIDIPYTVQHTFPEFPIQLDTGSSDVWVLPPIPIELTNVTDIPANLTFGIGEVSGNIAFADMSFGPYSVPSQGILTFPSSAVSF